MTYLFNNQVDAVPRLLDAFSRLRVSTPLTLFEHENLSGTNTFKWETSVSGTGTITDPTSLASNATVLGTGGTAAGSGAVRQTRAYLRFLAGKSLLGSMTFKFGLGVTGVAKRVGYFDTNNGIFLEQNGTTINFVVRSSSTGSAVDTATAQSAWNIDKLDGTGPSGMTFDPTGSQNIRFDMIGTSAYRLYFYYRNQYWLVHEISNTNLGTPTVPSSTVSSLPIRQEITNLTTAGASATMNISNCNLVSEGAVEPVPAYDFSTNNGITTISVTTRAPILTVQTKTLGVNGLRNFGSVIPTAYQIYADQSVFYELVLNGTLTGAAFASVDAKSLINVDHTATAITGGTIIDSGYISNSNKQSGTLSLSIFFPLVYTSLLNKQDSLSIVITALSTAAHCAGSFSWAEFY